MKRFVHEARLTASLRHENTVGVIDHGIDEGIPWIVYEFVFGGSLETAMTMGALGLPYAIEITIAIASALDVDHREGIIHRDVKPGSVLLTDLGVPKLTDFGIAMWSRDRSYQTRTGLIMGTPAYLAPEYIQGKSPTIHLDIYALGCMFFQMVTGHVPFPGTDPLQILTSHVKDPPPSPRTNRPDLSAALDPIIFQVLNKDPTSRYQKAKDFAEVLQELSNSLDSSAGVPATPTPPHR